MSPTPFLHPFARPGATADEFRTIVRGEGATVWDADGNAYIDALASLWYCAVGHGRTEIAERVAAQMGVLENFNTFDVFTNEPAERFAAAVSQRAPVPGNRVFLTSSGSEAVDTALKLSRLTFSLRGEGERNVVIGRDGGYHGVAYGGTSTGGLPLNREHFAPLVGGVLRVGAHDLDQLEAVFAEHGPTIAAVIAEPVQGAGGVHPAAPGYLPAVRELCTRHGALLILDEVITGFGRLGSWFGADVYGVEPDLITFAKGCTSGYLPLGGVVVGRAVLDVIEADPTFVLRHGFTYSGHPTACVAGLANIEILEREELLARAPVIADRLGGPLRAMAAEGSVVEARGVGGIWAVTLPASRPATLVRDRMLAAGVIPRPIGPDVIALCPPLVISDDELDRCVAALTDALAAGPP